MNEQIPAQLPYVLDASDFRFLGARYEGKVRDNYTAGDVRYIITSDRLSCFDRVVTSVPFKGQALNEMAVFWFQRSASIVRNHIIDVPDPNVLVVRSCEVLPVEVVVRGYLAGSAWRDYESGRDVSGVRLPPGLKPSAKLPEPIITPSTKAERGTHDMPISEAEIVSGGLVERSLWQQIRETALALFELGQRSAAERGLILVDTKYEFGLHQGKMILVDEIHTMDSSRYWVASSWAERHAAGEPPEMLDKEPTRQWLITQGFMGEGKIPEFTDEHRCKIAEHYVGAFERITGRALSLKAGPVASRIEARLKHYTVPAH